MVIRSNTVLGNSCDQLNFTAQCFHGIFCCFQNHLLSVFDNTRLVTFDEKVYDKILCINSQEGETISLDGPVMAQVMFRCI